MADHRGSERGVHRRRFGEPTSAFRASQSVETSGPPALRLDQWRLGLLPNVNPIINGWSSRRSGIGVYGTGYLYRSVVAMVGLGANLAEDADYPLLITDRDGELPTGEHDYVLDFDTDGLPPVDAFWSVTLYDGDGYTVPNEIDRYANRRPGRSQVRRRWVTRHLRQPDQSGSRTRVELAPSNRSAPRDHHASLQSET